jgi:hypothetical protein
VLPKIGKQALNAHSKAVQSCSKCNQSVMSDKELIKICLREISHQSGYADPGSMRQRDFEHLSAEIEKGTGILISISTC